MISGLEALKPAAEFMHALSSPLLPNVKCLNRFLCTCARAKKTLPARIGCGVWLDWAHAWRFTAGHLMTRSSFVPTAFSGRDETSWYVFFLHSHCCWCLAVSADRNTCDYSWVSEFVQVFEIFISHSQCRTHCANWKTSHLTLAKASMCSAHI